MKKLGEILLDQGLLTPDQLENVLRRQSMTGGRFGEHLVQMMLMDERQVNSMLSLQKGVPAVKPSDLENIPDEVLEKMPASIVETYRVIPFRVLGRRMHVAMLDPEDIQIVDEISHRSGYIIRPYVCMESILNRALAKYYQIATTTSADASVEASLMQDLIVHDNQYTADKAVYDAAPGLVAIGDSGQFSMFDRANILGVQTKNLFLDSTSNRETLGYFLQFMEQICDSTVFLAVDGIKNFFWRDVAEFRRGAKGVALYDKLYKSPFWNKYLLDPDLRFIFVSEDNSELRWVAKMLRLEHVKGFVLSPVRISSRLLGVVMGGSTSELQLKEEMDTFQKLQLVTECSLTILRCKRTIQEVE